MSDTVEVVPPWAVNQCIDVGAEQAEDRIWEVLDEMRLSVSEKMLVEHILRKAFPPDWISKTGVVDYMCAKYTLPK